MRVEYNGAVAFPETVEEAADLMKRLTASPNGRRQTPAPQVIEQSQNGDQPPNIATVIRGLRDHQRAVFAAIVGNDGAAQGTVLMETLGITRQALGGLLVGVRRSLELAGVNPEDVLRARETVRGREYFTPVRSLAGVREGVGM